MQNGKRTGRPMWALTVLIAVGSLGIGWLVGRSERAGPRVVSAAASPAPAGPTDPASELLIALERAHDLLAELQTARLASQTGGATRYAAEPHEAELDDGEAPAESEQEGGEALTIRLGTLERDHRQLAAQFVNRMILEKASQQFAERLAPFDASPPAGADSRGYLLALQNTMYSPRAHLLWTLDRVRSTYGPPDRVEFDEDDPSYQEWIYTVAPEEEFTFEFVAGFCTGSG